MGLYMMDVLIHAPPKVFDKRFHLPVLPFDDEFNPPIREIANIAIHVILQRDILSGVAEANALNASVKQIGSTLHEGRSNRHV